MRFAAYDIMGLIRYDHFRGAGKKVSPPYHPQVIGQQRGWKAPYSAPSMVSAPTLA